MSVIMSAAPGTRRRPRRAGRGTGRQTRPQSRPPRPLRGPELGPDAVVSARCYDAPQFHWRLTDRGLTAVATLVIAIGLVIATAALVVVGLTALRVTGDSYLPTGQLQALR